ncbi:helix-turn-helix domain-containing protein [[Ruminococcus] torques]|uniref:helix-turn-helix domain-containing protein n=1 Tax=[Ruminococcus] torques TaxID=33039 RepID=UPI0035214982
MAICYDKLWKLLIDKKMNRTELKEASGISFNVLARLGKNEPVSFESIEKICFTLNCKIEDVVEIQKEEPLQIDSDAVYNHRTVCWSWRFGFRDRKSWI